MKTKIFFGAAISLASASVLVGVNSANAATITGAGTIDFSGAVNVSIIDNPPLGLPLGINDNTFLDFLPVGGGSGEIATLFAEEATGGFSEFGVGISPSSPNVSIIVDTTAISGGLTVQEPFLVFLDPGVDPSGVIPANEDRFNLADLGSVEFDESIVAGQINTTVSVPAIGQFISDTGEIFDGFGVFSTQFEGLNTLQTQQALLDGVQNQSFSASFTATNIPNDIPEPSSLVSLGVLLVGGTLFLKKKQNKGIVS